MFFNGVPFLIFLAFPLSYLNNNIFRRTYTYVPMTLNYSSTACTLNMKSKIALGEADIYIPLKIFYALTRKCILFDKKAYKIEKSHR